LHSKVSSILYFGLVIRFSFSRNGDQFSVTFEAQLYYCYQRSIAVHRFVTGEITLVLYADDALNSETGERELTIIRWGLISVMPPVVTHMLLRAAAQATAHLTGYLKATVVFLANSVAVLHG
jgi:hypothetical protein